MAIKKNEIELAKFKAIKLARSVIRLKHSMAADEELNEKLPEVEKKFDKAVLRGELPDEATILSFLQ